MSFMGMRAFTASVLALGLLYGCGGQDAASGPAPTPSATTESGATLVEDVPTATPTPPPTSDPTDDPGNDILFLALVRANAAKLEQAPDASVIELGKGVCEAYDEGGTTTEIGANIALSGVMTIAQAGYFIGVTTSSYCPEHDGKK
jgi:hypothetical protein